MKKEIIAKKVEKSQLVEQTFDFWFNNKDSHIRSPFPEYIRPDLKRIATLNQGNPDNNQPLAHATKTAKDSTIAKSNLNSMINRLLPLFF